MIEKPPRVAGLIGDWVAAKLCREAIFNLKLPMKKRFEELETCRAIIEKKLATAGIEASIHFKQLCHDQEEVTRHIRVIKAR